MLIMGRIWMQQPDSIRSVSGWSQFPYFRSGTQLLDSPTHTILDGSKTLEFPVCKANFEVVMAIPDIVQVVPPPDAPVATGTSLGWAEVELRIGTRFPGDFINLINQYGSGWFELGDILGLTIWSPFDIYYWTMNETTCRLFGFPYGRDTVHGGPARPHPLGPSLIPIGKNNDGTYIFYFALGNPEDWQIQTIHFKNRYFQQFDMSITSFLAETLAGRLPSVLFYWNGWYPDGSSQPPPARFTPGAITV
ncbi:MAG: hypothetical protein C0467_27090 [Planctomycetaceae bacterium]|nr:hypothetical protein [Planctomycetaceae bacterium]